MMPNHSHEVSRVEETSKRNGLFPVRRNGRMEWLSYEQLFAAGHRLWLKGQYSTASSVFEELAAAKDHGPERQSSSRIAMRCLAISVDAVPR